MRETVTDTSPEAEAVWLDLMRKAGAARKFSIVSALTRTAMRCAWNGIKEAHPDLPDREIDILFIKYHHGEKLADEYRGFLERKRDND